MKHSKKSSVEEVPALTGQKKKGNKSGLWILIVFIVVSIAAMFTGGFGAFRSNEKKDSGNYSENYLSDREEKVGYKNSTDDETVGSENYEEITITENEPDINNILIPPGSDYSIRTSVPVWIKFEDVEGKQFLKELRPGQKTSFPEATPTKVWRQKKGVTKISYIYKKTN